MEDMLTRGRQVLASQPFSVLLGAELLEYSEGSAVLRIPIKAELKQQHGFMAGSSAMRRTMRSPMPAEAL